MAEICFDEVEHAHGGSSLESRARMGGLETMLPTLEQTFAAFHHGNGNLAYRLAIETVRRDCAKQIIDRWKSKLSVVDVWADSHCETVILHAIMH